MHLQNQAFAHDENTTDGAECLIVIISKERRALSQKVSASVHECYAMLYTKQGLQSRPALSLGEHIPLAASRTTRLCVTQFYLGRQESQCTPSREVPSKAKTP